jgi:hypothetical protein
MLREMLRWEERAIAERRAEVAAWAAFMRLLEFKREDSARSIASARARVRGLRRRLARSKG